MGIGDPIPPTERDTAASHLSAHIYCGQTVARLSNCWALVQMATVRHLEFVLYALLGRSWRVFDGLCRTDRDSVWVKDSGGPKKACNRWWSRSPCEGANFRGKDMPGRARRHFLVNSAKNGWTDRDAVWVVDSGGPKEPRIRCIRWRCILVLPVEYHWTIHMRRRCGLLSSYFGHLLLLR